MPDPPPDDDPLSGLDPEAISDLAHRARDEIGLDAALELLNHGTRHHPDDAGLRYLVALASHTNNDNDTARDALAHAERCVPEDAEALDALAGFAWRALKDDAQAERLWQRALRANPAHTPSALNLAEMLDWLGRDLDQAEALLRAEAARSDLGKQVLASFLWPRGRGIDEAEALYQQVLDANPRDPNATHNYARFLDHVRGDAERAEALYLRSCDLDPTGDALGNTAGFLRDHGGDPELVKQLYARAIESDPRPGNQATNLAMYLLSVGEYDEADAVAHAAWHMQAEPRPQESVEVCFVRTLAAALTGRPDTFALRKLKHLITTPYFHTHSSLHTCLDHARDAGLTDARINLYRLIADAIVDEGSLPDLQRHPAFALLDPSDESNPWPRPIDASNDDPNDADA